MAVVEGRQVDQALQLIDYSHIPIQTLLPKAEAKVVRIDLKKDGGWVGYIKGAGDEIPSALKNMGYRVWEMKEEEVVAANLKKLDAVVLGIRALNTNERIRHFMPDNCIKFFRSEEHTSELQSHSDLVCRLLLEKKKK